MLCFNTLLYVMSFNRNKRHGLTKGTDCFYQKNLGLPQKSRLSLISYNESSFKIKHLNTCVPIIPSNPNCVRILKTKASYN